MKNRIFAAIFALCTAASLCGCADVDGNNSSVLKQDEQSSGNVLSGESAADDVSDNVGEKQEYPTKCKIYRQTAVNFTEEQLLSFFSETPERTYYSESNTAVYTAETELGNTSGTSLNFLTDTGSLCMMAYGAVYGEGIEEKTQNFDFASRDEIFGKAVEKLKDFGVSEVDWYINKLFAVSAGDLEKFKEKEINSAKENPFHLNESELQKEIEAAERIAKRKSKDFYYIELRPEFDKIHTYSGYTVCYGNGDYFVVPASCVMCYSEDGIESFSVNNIAETQTSEDVVIIPFDKAKELILKKYDDIIFDGEVEVNNIELVYMPIPQNNLGQIADKFETRPFYAFYCTITEERDGKTISENITTYFDAVTGDEFATEQIMLGG